MAESYAAYKQSLADAAPSAVQNLRAGTVAFLTAPVQQPSMPADIGNRVVNAIFCLWSLSTAFTQIGIAATLLLGLPGVSLVLLLKELCGFALVARWALPALAVRPTPRLFERILYPFPSAPPFGRLAPFLNAGAYAFGSLSNLRAAAVYALNCRWGTHDTHLGHDSDLAKIGNFLCMLFSLTIKTFEERPILRLWFFKDAILSVLFMVGPFVMHFLTLANVNDFLLDVEEGKIGRDGMSVAIEAVYLLLNGENPPPAFAARLIAGKIAQIEQKAKED
jgi:hypothetical protein